MAITNLTTKELEKRISILEDKLYKHGWIPRKMEVLLEGYYKQYENKCRR